MTMHFRALLVALYLPLGGCVCFTVGDGDDRAGAVYRIAYRGR